MKINLTAKITGTIILVFSILFSLISYIQINNYTNDLTDFFTERAKATANSLNASFSNKDDILNKDKLLLNIKKNILLDSEIIEISFNLNEGGELRTYVSSSNLSSDGQTSDIENMNAFQSNTLTTSIITQETGRTLKVITPVTIGGQKIGTFQIIFTLESVDAKIKTNTNIFIFTYSLLMFLFILIFYFFLRFIVIKPISEISLGMKMITQNNFDYSIIIKSNDEIGRLANSFNRMTTDLKQSKNKLEAYSQSLELQVADRVREINEKLIELEELNKFMVGRELKMVELKDEIAKLKKDNIPTKTDQSV